MQPATVWKEILIVLHKNNTKNPDKNYGTTKKLIHLLDCWGTKYLLVFAYIHQNFGTFGDFMKIVKPCKSKRKNKVFSQSLFWKIIDDIILPNLWVRYEWKDWH